MTEPLVSVVMCVYNGDKYLAEAVDSILTQTYKSFELIVVNDGSTDKSLDILNSYKDSRLKIISQRNQGVSVACNRAIKAATGKYIARHDADDTSSPKRLSIQVSFMEANPDIDLLGSNFHITDGAGKTTATTNVFTNPDELKLAEIFSNQFGQGSVMIRAACLDGIQPYNPKYIIAHDYDLWIRISRKGRTANLKEPLYNWRSVGEGLSTSPERIEKMKKEAYQIRVKEFEFFLKNKRSYRMISLHPSTTRGGVKKYFEMKNTMFRNMALIYSYQGLRRTAVPVFFLAIAHAPWVGRSYKQLFIIVFRKNLIPKIEYEYI